MIVDDYLKCSICLIKYNETSHKPVVLVSCGHTICEMCVILCSNRCPSCRLTIESTVVNWTLMNIMRSFTDIPTPSDSDQIKSLLDQTDLYINEFDHVNKEKTCFNQKNYSIIEKRIETSANKLIQKITNRKNDLLNELKSSQSECDYEINLNNKFRGEIIEIRNKLESKSF
jgi:hypothetical protein